MHKLFCITYAGGSAQFFKGLIECLEEIECYAIEYAGHSSRYKEPFYATFQEMVEDVALKINSLISENDDISILGYSMGSLVGYEIVCQGLIQSQVKHLFVAAHVPPKDSSSENIYRFENEQELLEYLNVYGGIPEKIRNNRIFLKTYFPVLKNDYFLLRKYQCNKKKVSCNLSVFYSKEDLTCKNIEDWNYFSEEKVSYYAFSGNHFFLNDNELDISAIITKVCCSNK